MATWDQVENNKAYQALPESEKAVVKQRFEASQNKQPATSAVNQTQAPSEAPGQAQTATPTPTAAKQPSALPTWDEVISKPEYQKLDDAGKDVVKQRYQKAGGTAEEAGILQNAQDLVVGAANSFQKGMVDKAVGIGRFFGADEWANEQEKQFKTAYDERVHNLQYTTGGKLGLDYGEIAGDIGATILAPEVMIPAMAAGATGNVMNMISPEEREAHPIASRAKALAVGGVDYAVNKALPGAGATWLKPLESKVLNAGITKTATDLIDAYLPKSVATITKATGKATLKTAENATVGATGGAAEGGATAAATGGDVVEGAKKGGISGGLFGGGLGAVGEVPGLARAGKQATGEAVQGIKQTASNIKAGIAPKPNIHPDLQGMNTKIESEYNNVHSADHTPEQKTAAYDSSPNLRASDTINAFDAHGFKATSQMAKGDQATADVLGASPKEADRKVYDAKTKSADLKASLDSMNKSIESANMNNRNLHKEMKSNLKDSDDLQHVNDFFDATTQVQKFHNKSDTQSADVQAIRAQKALDNMSPDTRALIEQHYITPKGFGDTVDPITFSKRYGDVLSKANDLNTQYRGAGNESSLLDSYDHAPAFLKGVINAKTMGAAETINQAGKFASAIVGARRRKTQAKLDKAAQERQSQLESTQQQNPNVATPEMQANVSAFGAKRTAQRKAKAVDEWHKTNDAFDADLKNTVNTNTIETPHVKTVENVQQYRNSITDKDLAKQITPDNFNNKQLKADIKKLDTQRNKVVDPALKKKLTLDNINDETHVSNIKAMDRAQNRDLADQKLQQKAAQAKTNREAVDAVETQKLDDFRKGAGKEYSKDLISQAITETTKGGKALNADRVINHLTKIADKSTMPGSKEWFVNQVQKMPHVEAADKAGMIKEVNKTFSSGKPDKEALSNQLGQWEKQIHTKNNRGAYADRATAEAKARNEAIDTHNQAIVKASQVEDVSQAMEKAFDAHDIPEYKKSDFIRRHTNKIFKDGVKTEAQKATAIKEAEQAAKEYALRVNRGKPGESEPEPTPTPEGEAGGTPPKGEPADKEPIPANEAETLEKHTIDHLGKTIKGKSVSEIQHEAELARERVNTHLANNPANRADMIAGINALERLSIRLAENPGKDIRDVIKQNDIMGIETAHNSGVKGLIFHALTGKNWDSSRKFLYGEGESTASKAAEKAAASKSGKPGKTNAQRFGVGKMPPKKIKVKPKSPPEPEQAEVRPPTKP